MARPSSIDRLPNEVKETIGRLRQDGRTIDEILAKLQELDADVSRAALGRHVKKLAAVGERMRRSKDLATALATRFGEEPDSRLASLNLEILHGAVFDLLTAEGDDAEDNGSSAPVFLDPKAVRFLSDTVRNLAQTAKIDADRILKIRAEALKEAAASAGKEAKAMGLTDDKVRQIEKAVLGVER